jgi:hypothetical protein
MIIYILIIFSSVVFLEIADFEKRKDEDEG